MSVFQVPRLFSSGRCSVFPEGCGLDCILCPSWRLCTAGFTAPALPGYLHLHCVLESAPALPAYLHLHCVLELSNKDCLFSLAIGSRASVPWQNDLAKMDPASASDLRGFLSHSNSRMDHQDEQMCDAVDPCRSTAGRFRSGKQNKMMAWPVDVNERWLLFTVRRKNIQWWEYLHKCSVKKK